MIVLVSFVSNSLLNYIFSKPTVVGLHYLNLDVFRQRLRDEQTVAQLSRRLSKLRSEMQKLEHAVGQRKQRLFQLLQKPFDFCSTIGDSMLDSCFDDLVDRLNSSYATKFTASDPAYDDGVVTALFSFWAQKRSIVGAP